MHRSGRRVIRALRSGASRWIRWDGIILSPISLRQAYPAEFDLMARLAGLRLREGWGGWNSEPYTASSWPVYVGVYEWTE